MKRTAARVYYALARTVIRHRVECWTRAATVALLRRDVRRPDTVLADTPRWNNTLAMEAWGEDVVEREATVPHEHHHVREHRNHCRAEFCGEAGGDDDEQRARGHVVRP